MYSRIDADLSSRLAFLRVSLSVVGLKNVVYLYERPDQSTFRYRVYNVCQALAASGIVRGHFFFLDEISRLRLLLDEIDVLVLVRVRWSPRVETLILRQKARAKRVYFDVDDLVFDERYLPVIMNTLACDLDDDATLDWWHAYVSRISRTAILCDGFTCTNIVLARKIKERFGLDALIVPNLLNTEQVETSASLLRRDKTKDGTFRVGYFSGTPSHNNDFFSIAHELYAFLQARQNARLVIVGYLALPYYFDSLVQSERIAFEPLKDYLDLQESIRSVDVNIVPLIVNDFTDCKSELKFFEAGIVGVTTVASPTHAYQGAIDHGRNGFLCGQGQWHSTLDEVYQGAFIDADSLVEEARNNYLNLNHRTALEATLLRL